MNKEYLDSILYKTAGKILKRERERSGLSLSQLSSKLSNNSNKQSLSLIENGKKKLKVNTFIEICYALNLDPQETLDEINLKYLKSAKINEGVQQWK